MAELVATRRGVYRDSVTLMQLTNEVRSLDGVVNALVATATELNLELMRELGFTLPEGEVRSDDLLIAIVADNQAAVDSAESQIDAALSATSTGGGTAAATGEAPPRTLGQAVEHSGAGLALVSVPGEFAYAEGVDALRAGANVMIFSDGVSAEHERALKIEAGLRGRLVMGPDCGTAVIAGLGLGFANRLRPGHVSMVAASGTGAQHLGCLLDGAGIGVNHILGVGGRDLADEIGGIATLQALEALDADEATHLIVVISKVPSPEVAARIEERAATLSKPVILGLLGPGGEDLTRIAQKIASRLGLDFPEPASWKRPRKRDLGGARLTGLFSGGTLAQEASIIATEALGDVAAIRSFGDAPGPAGFARHKGHMIVDLGDDRLTRGRPHPMIDQTLRLETLRALPTAGEARVVLFDVVLGLGAHPNPAAELGPETEALLRRGGDRVAVVASLIGSENDPQELVDQARVLDEAGADVYTSNATAARAAVELVTGGGS